MQDRAGRGLPALEGATWALAGAAGQSGEFTQAFTLFNTRTPQIFADVDRTKAELIGVPISRVFETLSVYLGSTFVNDFNVLGRTYRVMAQADDPFRLTLRDIANLKTRSASGAMAPIGASPPSAMRRGRSACRATISIRPPRCSSISRAASPRARASRRSRSSRRRSCRKDFDFEWTEIALQEKLAGNTAAIAFGLAVVFVFLLLAALYESLLLPVSVILIVPMCILAAMLGVVSRGLDRNILVEIGLVVLIGLAAKNAILIVEFAKQAEDGGQSKFDAAVTAARTRLRPILMTSLAFILGVLPLAVAEGAGAEMRQSIGTAVFFGMLGVTLFGLAFTPTFYVVVRIFARYFQSGSARESTPAAARSAGVSRKRSACTKQERLISAEPRGGSTTFGAGCNDQARGRKDAPGADLTEMFFAQLRALRRAELTAAGGAQSRHIFAQAGFDLIDEGNVGAAESQGVAHAVGAFLSRALSPGGGRGERQEKQERNELTHVVPFTPTDSVMRKT